MITDRLQISVSGAVARLELARPHKRNALDMSTIAELHDFFSAPPADVRVAVLCARGDHFSAGLDLSEHVSRSAVEAFESSRTWHRTFDAIEFGRLPVVCALKGAVIGGGLELATACHVRVADPTTFFALPEGQRGISLGGGGSVRVSRLIGVDRVREMMLTGRRYASEDGLRIGLVHELAQPDQLETRVFELARAIAQNAPVSTFVILQSLPRIAAMAPDHGLYMESLSAAMVQTDPEAEDRMSQFLDKR
jgi:enoyl-CoA hydratase/carnithine racemase